MFLIFSQLYIKINLNLFIKVALLFLIYIVDHHHQAYPNKINLKTPLKEAV